MDDHSTHHTNNQQAHTLKAANLLGSPKAFVPPVWKMPTASLKPSNSLSGTNPIVPFSIHSLDKGKRGDRLFTQIPPLVWLALETASYRIKSGDYSQTDIALCATERGFSGLQALDDATAIAAMREELIDTHERADLLPHKWAYQVLGCQRHQYQLRYAKESLGDSIAKWAATQDMRKASVAGLALLCGLVHGPITKHHRQLLEDEIEDWLDCLAFRRKQYEKRIIRAKRCKT